MILNKIKKILWRGFLTLLYQPRCVVCSACLKEKNLTTLCPECLAKVKPNSAPTCIKCGRHLDVGITPALCLDCKQETKHFDRAYSIFIYEGVIKELIHKLKYNKRISIADTLSILSLDFINQKMEIAVFDYIIPVPIHKTRLFKREFNQSHLIAKNISRAFNKKLLGNSLVRVKHTKSQTDLTRRERFDNLKGAFEARRKDSILNKKILIIDDVFTSGATINEASRILKASGAKEVVGLTIARGV